MSIKVLVADDSITIQKVIGIIFGGDDYSLTVVDNGKTAIDKALEINPDILLIDALMPGMTGYEVSEVIRSTPLLASKPILIMTGSFEPFDEEKVKKCGADDFITKPFESQQIISKVKNLLELGKSRAQPVQASQPQHATEAAPDRPDAQPQVIAPTDIWSAFTPEFEAPVEVSAANVDSAPSAANLEPDVFAIVTEESDSQLIPGDVTSSSYPLHRDSQWFPVEETTFEFEEETVADFPHTAITDQAVPTKDSYSGEITFEDDIATDEITTSDAINLEESPALEEAVPAEMATPAVTPPSISLTEEQLKAVIASLSKEVIERIVWEVVPDLAEVLIREAIRKIKEGV